MKFPFLSKQASPGDSWVPALCPVWVMLSNMANKLPALFRREGLAFSPRKTPADYLCLLGRENRKLEKLSPQLSKWELAGV